MCMSKKVEGGSGEAIVTLGRSVVRRTVDE
jgi:hypothetical protein